MKKKRTVVWGFSFRKKKLMRKGKKLFMGFERSSFFCAFLRVVVFVCPLFCVFCVFVSSQKSPLNHHLVSRYIESSWASSPAEEEEEVDARRRWKKKEEEEGTWSTSALVYSSTGTSDRRAVSRSTRTIIVVLKDTRASVRIMGKGGTRKLGTSCCINNNNTNRDAAARTIRRTTVIITTRTTRISSLLARRRSAAAVAR